MDLIIGNLCSVFATLSDVFSSSRKTTRSFLLWQCLGQFFYGLSAIVLKGYSAAIQNVICIIRNLAAVRNINSKLLEWVLVISATVLGIVCNNLAWIGILPVIANLEYSLAVFRFKENEIVLKSAFACNVLLYTVFNGAIRNYTGMIADFVLFVVTLVFLVKKLRSKKEAQA